MTNYESQIKAEESLLLAALSEFWESTPRPTPTAFLERFRGCTLAIPLSGSIGPSRLIGRKTTAEERRRMLHPPKPETKK